MAHLRVPGLASGSISLSCGSTMTPGEIDGGGQAPRLQDRPSSSTHPPTHNISGRKAYRLANVDATPEAGEPSVLVRRPTLSFVDEAQDCHETQAGICPVASIRISLDST
ncbi:hypothetical protein BDV59DRAFT_32741 [Aspergillus ambiguus]|uniref:uncharacterized protein n=1 Tax=Aspergillus ambiguus TaxID=176160 RepID=UPI003CCDFE15